jgi:Flp pilus assembly protein TadB
MIGTFFLGAFLLLMAATPIYQARAAREKVRRKSQSAYLVSMLKELEAAGYSVEERVQMVQAERQRLESERTEKKELFSMRLMVVIALSFVAVMVIGTLKGIPPIVLFLFSVGALLIGLMLAAVVIEMERKSK